MFPEVLETLREETGILDKSRFLGKTPKPVQSVTHLVCKLPRACLSSVTNFACSVAILDQVLQNGLQLITSSL